jgi:sensor histidine kinase YesM
MLAENAIKHNAVSKETPLTISISVKDDKLIIENNLNKKMVSERSAGFGLENIKARYRLLTDDEIEIINDQNKFRVLIPLITLEHEHIDS